MKVPLASESPDSFWPLCTTFWVLVPFSFLWSACCAPCLGHLPVLHQLLQLSDRPSRMETIYCIETYMPYMPHLCSIYSMWNICHHPHICATCGYIGFLHVLYSHVYDTVRFIYQHTCHTYCLININMPNSQFPTFILQHRGCTWISWLSFCGLSAFLQISSAFSICHVISAGQK